ncbi:MAG: hypothetical protein EA366_16190 [Spirulina sp. DLM2.Bin59]|nr:MAG: hypothetical protein EA366_16190 [Spirulina sp. DLM2.Bin59]
MNRSRLNPGIIVAWLVLLAGCEFLNSVNPLATPDDGGFDPVATDPNGAATAPATTPVTVPPSETPFRDAVNKAMDAANAVQVAQDQADWQAVAVQWQEAIALMQQVPADDPNYAIAQEKVTEYTGYLQYAQQNAAQ